MSNVSTWSTTAGSNNSSPPDGWPEGMARSAVNDAAREMMAAIAKWYTDARASLTTAGSSDAYTLTSNSTYASLASIPPIFFKADRVNISATPTLNVDGLGARTWYKGPGKRAWQIGEILASSIYGVAYNSTLDAFESIGETMRAYTPKGHLFGLTLSNNVSDAVNDIDVTTGLCTSDDGLDTIELNSALTKRLDSGWVVGTNQGGLDTGSIANDVYHVFAIKRPDTGVVDILFSASATAPTMPGSYTLKRRLGSIIRASAAIRLFWQNGDSFNLKTVALERNTETANVAWGLITLVGVPDGIQVRPVLTCNISSADSATTFVAVGDARDTGNTNPTTLLYVRNTRSIVTHITSIFTDTTGRINFQLNFGSSGDSLLQTNGWVDDRGRSL